MIGIFELDKNKYTLTVVAILMTGCVSSQPKREFTPLPPEKLQDLRFICDGWVYKSVTHDDYIIKEDC